MVVVFFSFEDIVSYKRPQEAVLSVYNTGSTSISKYSNEQFNNFDVLIHKFMNNCKAGVFGLKVKFVITVKQVVVGALLNAL